MESTAGSLRIALGADHAGFEYKEIILRMLEQEHEVMDFGTFTSNSVDYPDFVHPVSDAIEDERADFAILFCGSANGVAITANKHFEVRAAIAWEAELAMLSRQHNDANIVCIPCRFIDIEAAKGIVKTFLSTQFEGGRHERRVRKITDGC